eukprot:g27833.t1
MSQNLLQGVQAVQSTHWEGDGGHSEGIAAEQRQADEIRRELRDPRIAHFISWTETEQLQTYLLDMRGREVALDVLRRVRERVSNRSRSE